MSASARSERAVVVRIIHAVVFLSFGAASFAAGYPEVQQALRPLLSPFHFGEPPHALVLLSLLTVLVGALLLAAKVLRGRAVPLWVSAVILAGTVGTVLTLPREVPRGRTWASADREILDRASRVHRHLVDALQEKGELPRDEALWKRVGAELESTPSPARDRRLAFVPYSLVRQSRPDDLPSPLVPGAMLLWVSEDGAAFELRPVGFTPEGEVSPLQDEAGAPLVLKGTFNPDMRTPKSPLPELPPVRGVY